MTFITRKTVPALFLVSLTLGALLPRALASQNGGPGTGGAVRLAQAERMSGNWRRVLMIGAHPDDEDTELLAILSRGMGIQTAYLSLTRGDGGQNLIGPELGEALGVLRTEELAKAREVDGARQFFTRAYDFGFSKTPEEAFRAWKRDSVLKDMVRIIRRFRPHVIVSVWSGTPADGHGHHQASGILSLEAFHAAGDSSRFPELRREGLSPWQPAKFYRTAGRFNAATPSLTFDGGVIDPATGLSLHQLAVRSRAQHRSQNQGNLEEPGPSRAGVRLEERADGRTGPDDSLFAGIAPDSHVASEPSTEVALTRLGLVLDAATNDNEVTPSQQLPVTLTAWNAGRDTDFVRLGMVGHVGYTSRGDACPQGERAIAPGELFRCNYVTTVWDTASPSEPYYLARPRVGSLYQWIDAPAEERGEPSELPLQARFIVSSQRGGTANSTSSFLAYREVQGRFRDPVLGEVRKPVMIVPRIAVDLQPSQLLWPVGQRVHRFHVALEHLAPDSADAAVSLQVPPGWTATVAPPVHFTREGERADVMITVTAPLKVAAREYSISARVISGHDTLDTGLYRIRYPHIRDRNLVTGAVSRVVVAPVIFPSVGEIGYVRGGGDIVPEAMVNAGLKVAVLTGDELERGALERFHVIVIGPRAYEADESLVRAHPRLMRWLEAGGTLVIQYQQTPYVAGGFPPRPFTLVAPTQSRVTDETAAVTMLAPTHQVVRWPNVIDSLDFSNWVQERGLDFPPTHDAVWTAIFSMHDPDEKPLDGALLVAHVGRGTAVYTGLAFHRQLPAIVPGAWRLWANILGAGQVRPVVKR